MCDACVCGIAWVGSMEFLEQKWILRVMKLHHCSSVLGPVGFARVKLA